MMDPNKNYTIYYQWVVFMLCINALIFRIPHVIWKTREGGLMKEFCSKEAQANLSINEALLKNYCGYFGKIKGTKTSYYIWFLVCQCLNIAVTASNFVLNDHFLDGNFKSYGMDVIHYSQLPDTTTEHDPKCNAFPTKVNCEMTYVGKSGTPGKASGLCILSQNIINEKIYFVLWFWFVFLLLIGSLQILLEVALIFVPALRSALISSLIGTHLSSNMKRYLLNDCSLGDWFLLYQIGKNCDKYFFYELMENLASSANGRQEDEDMIKRSLLDSNHVDDHEMSTLNHC